MNIKKFQLFSLIKDDIEIVKKTISDVLYRQKKAETATVIEHLLASQGKLLRPALVFLAAYAVKPNLTADEKHRLTLCATAIELIHMASLVHDDVIDDADVRRDSKSVKAKFGNPVAVTSGVYLYSVALQLIAEVGSIKILDELSSTVQKMCEGELLQYSLRDKTSYDIDLYYSVLESKTAVLFKMACMVGCYLFDVEQKDQQALADYAMHLGYSFQLSDDYLDMFGDDADLNKKTGQDFVQGQFTLPVLLTLKKLDDKEKTVFFDLLDDQSLTHFEQLKKKAVSLGVQNDLATIVHKRVLQSKTALESNHDSNYKEALCYLADFVGDRVKI